MNISKFINLKSSYLKRRIKPMSNLFEDAEVIHRYTRKQAIEDGILVDLSEIAGEAGIKYPVAVTRGVFELLDDTSSPGVNRLRRCAASQGRVAAAGSGFARPERSGALRSDG